MIDVIIILLAIVGAFRVAVFLLKLLSGISSGYVRYKLDKFTDDRSRAEYALRLAERNLRRSQFLLGIFEYVGTAEVRSRLTTQIEQLKAIKETMVEFLALPREDKTTSAMSIPIPSKIH